MTLQLAQWYRQISVLPTAQMSTSQSLEPLNMSPYMVKKTADMIKDLEVGGSS